MSPLLFRRPEWKSSRMGDHSFQCALYNAQAWQRISFRMMFFQSFIVLFVLSQVFLKMCSSYLFKIRRSSICYTSLKYFPCVPDPWIFCTDPDPTIWTTELQTWICGFQDANKHVSVSFLLIFIFIFCLLMVGSGSRRPKILRIRNTGTRILLTSKVSSCAHTHRPNHGTRVSKEHPHLSAVVVLYT